MSTAYLLAAAVENVDFIYRLVVACVGYQGTGLTRVTNGTADLEVGGFDV